MSLIKIADDAPENQKGDISPHVYNQFSYGPTNKFTQMLDIAEMFEDENLKNNILVTLTCAQVVMPAPFEYLRQKMQ